MRLHPPLPIIMNCLVDIKQLLLQHNFKNITSGGWYLVCQGDRWAIAHDVVYLNNDPVTKKEIFNYIKQGPKVMLTRRPVKMITPRGFNHDSESIEVSDE